MRSFFFRSGVAATHLVVSMALTATVGDTLTVTVAALDASNNTATQYNGTVQFTCTDTAATLPPSAMLSNGAGTFSVTLTLAGTQTVTATDATRSSVTGHSGGIVVSMPAFLADFDASTLSLSNGANVNTWPDNSGNGNNASTLTGTAPTFVATDSTFNNKPSVSFGGAGSLKTAAFSSPPQPVTVFVVYSQTWTGSATNVFDGLSTDNVELFAGTATAEEMYAGTALVYSYSAYPTGAVLRTLVFNGNSSNWYQDGALQQQGASGSHSMSGVMIGALGNGSHFLNGKIARLIVCAGALSDPARIGVENSLKAEYGLPSIYSRKLVAGSVLGGLGYCSFPALALLANGNILAAFDDGDQIETTTNYQIDKALSTDGGLSWTWTQNIYSDRGIPATSEMNLGMTQLASGRILLPFYAVQATRTRILYSDDNGVTWPGVLASVASPLSGYTSMVPFGVILEPSPGGTIYMPVYAAATGSAHYDSILIKSADHGLTWSLQGVIIPTDGTHDYDETSVVQVSGSNYLAVTRRDPVPRKLYLTTSSDSGATWSAATEIAAGYGGVAPCLLKLASGNILLLFTARESSVGVLGMLSTDGGATWGTAKQVYTAPSSPTGYQAAIQKADGKIIVMWTGNSGSQNVILSQGFDESFFT